MVNKSPLAEQQSSSGFQGLQNDQEQLIHQYTNMPNKAKNENVIPGMPVRQPQRPTPRSFPPWHTGTDLPTPQAKTRMANDRGGPPLLTSRHMRSPPLPYSPHEFTNNAYQDASKTTTKKNPYQVRNKSQTHIHNTQNTYTHTPPSGAPAGERLAVVGEEGVTAPAARSLPELGRLPGPSHDQRRLVRAAGIARPEVNAGGPNR